MMCGANLLMNAVFGEITTDRNLARFWRKRGRGKRRGEGEDSGEGRFKGIQRRGDRKLKIEGTER
jgi:hypothetical protein